MTAAEAAALMQTAADAIEQVHDAEVRGLDAFDLRTLRQTAATLQYLRHRIDRWAVPLGR